LAQSGTCPAVPPSPVLGAHALAHDVVWHVLRLVSAVEQPFWVSAAAHPSMQLVSVQLHVAKQV
jgi:hypothetical protein